MTTKSIRMMMMTMMMIVMIATMMIVMMMVMAIELHHKWTSLLFSIPFHSYLIASSIISRYWVPVGSYSEACGSL